MKYQAIRGTKDILPDEAPLWHKIEAAARTLYFRAGGALSFSPPTEGAAFDEYISDPAKPVRGVREEVAPRKNRRHFADVVGKIHMFT